MQNDKHCQHIKGLLGIEKNNVFKNIVVLGDFAVMNDMHTIPSSANVCKLNKLIKIINYRAGNSKNILSEAEVKQYYQILFDKTKHDKSNN